MSTLKSTFLTSLVAILLLAACSDDETTLPIDNDPDDTPMDTMTMSMDTMTMGMDTMTMGGGDGMGMDTMTMGDGMGDGEGMGMDTMTMGGGDGTGNGDGTGGGDGMGGGNGMGMDTMTMGMDTMTMGMDTMTMGGDGMGMGNGMGMGMDTTTTTIWMGEELTFTLADNVDFMAPGNQDTLTANVIITRAADRGPIFNLAAETEGDQNSSPAGTEWALGRTDDLDGLEFAPFREAIGGRLQDVVGMELVLHLIEDNIFLNVTFTAWTVGRDNGGGFSYNRATP